MRQGFEGLYEIVRDGKSGADDLFLFANAKRNEETGELAQDFITGRAAALELRQTAGTCKI
jgi:hypothetical protein